MKRMTKNRELILRMVSEPNIEGIAPPITVDHMVYYFEYEYGYWGLEAPKKVAHSQINRTLRELVAEGLVIFEYRTIETYGNKLLQKVKHYQLLSLKDRNALLSEIHNALRIAKKANGVQFFASLLEPAWTYEQRMEFIPVLRRLIQKTHPDKVSGFEEQYIDLTKALDYVKTEIDILEPFRFF